LCFGLKVAKAREDTIFLEEPMLHVTTMPLGPLDTNCYLLHSDREAVVIDPGGDAHEILSFLEASNLTLHSVLNTHLHFDHIQGNADLVGATGVTVMASPKDVFLLDTELGGGGMMGFPRTPPFSVEPLEEGELSLLGTTCRVLATPGHSPGSLSFYFESIGVVFVGDLLFHRSVGRTDFPGSSERELLRSVRTKIFTLPEETVVYPGHGPETTVGQERLNNPFFTDFIR
jgi:glyoxylase-like metal-dependent hydrolase (beta-lactamase superfamily II)